MSAVVLTLPVAASGSSPGGSPTPARTAPESPDFGPARAGRDGGSPGPELPPLLPGLPNTPPERLQALFAAVVLRGLLDHDDAWVNDPAFEVCCDYAGLQGATPLKVRDLYNSGRINFRRLSACMLGYNKDTGREELAS